MKYYYCRFCGNLVEMVEDSGNEPVCCGRDMQELVPGEKDGAEEKHVPCVTFKKVMCDDLCVTKVHVDIGRVEHPNKPEHCIRWIEIETESGCQRKYLSCDEKPEADFVICCEERVTAVYAYCNIHGLWKATM